MKKGKILLIGLLVFFVNFVCASATCDIKEKTQIESEAVNVKVSSEKKTRVLDKGEYTPPDGVEDDDPTYQPTVDYFTIYITNLTENLYVTVKNSVTGEIKTYSYEDSDHGSISFDSTNITDIINYTFSVYSSDKTGCRDTKLSTLYLTTPRYNPYSNLEVCSNAKDFYLCYQYVTTPEENYDYVVDRVTKYLNGKINKDGEEIKEEVKEEKASVGDFIKKHPVIIVLSAIVIIGGMTSLVIVKKQRSKNDEK